MKNFKRLLALLLSILMCIAITACGSKDEEEDDEEENEKEETAIKEVEGDPECDHQWGETTTANTLVCTSESKYTRKCDDCGRIEIVRTEAPRGHKYDSDGERCEVCNKRTISSCKHENCEWRVIAEASCEKDGYKNKICLQCNFIQDVEYIYSTGHNTEYFDSKDPTCTEPGNNYYYACKNCDYTSFEKIPALGHNFIAGNCTRCNEKDPDITFITVEEPDVKELKIDKYADVEKTAENAVITTYDGNMADEKQKYTYTYTATYDGYIRIWVTEVYSGVNFRLAFKDSLGETLGYDNYISNNEGITEKVKAGETYTILLEGNDGTSTYKLHVGDQKATLDLSECTKLNEKVEFVGQRIYYTFTPKLSGRYRFDVSELINDAYIDLRINNRLGENLTYDSYTRNNEGITVDLTANETYQVIIAYNNSICEFILNVGLQKETKDITKYSVVKDSIQHYGQKNVYTFKPENDGTYRFALADFENDGYVEFYIYNHLNEKVYYDNYFRNGDYISANLKAGETYTIAVYMKTGLYSYTINISGASDPIDMTSNTAVNDKITFDGQTNTYNFEATEDGTYIFAVGNMSDEYASVKIYVYNENEVEVACDTSLNNNEFVKLESVEEGEVYTVVIKSNYKQPEYTFAIQLAK